MPFPEDWNKARTKSSLDPGLPIVRVRCSFVMMEIHCQAEIGYEKDGSIVQHLSDNPHRLDRSSLFLPFQRSILPGKAQVKTRRNPPNQAGSVPPRYWFCAG